MLQVAAGTLEVAGRALREAGVGIKRKLPGDSVGDGRGGDGSGSDAGGAEEQVGQGKQALPPEQ